MADLTKGYTFASGETVTPTKLNNLVDLAAKNFGIKQIVTQALSATNTVLEIPDDDTSPLISEGLEIWSKAITPSSASNKILIIISLYCGLQASSATANYVLSFFRGSTCIYVASYEQNDATEQGTKTIIFLDSPSTTSSTTYSIRAGRHATLTGGTLYINSDSPAIFNGMLATAPGLLIELTGVT